MAATRPAWSVRATACDSRLALEEPRDFDGFAYRAYLARQGVIAIASTYRLTRRRRSSSASCLRRCTGRRGRLAGRAQPALVPEPEAALAAGILLGVRSGIDPAINDAFARAGLTHVVAISGWNIAIVAALAASGRTTPARLPAGG